jgi:hypothetical protein
LPTKRTNGRNLGNDVALDRKYWDLNHAVSLFGTVSRGRNFKSEPFAILFGLRMLGFVPVLLLYLLLLLTFEYPKHTSNDCDIKYSSFYKL